MTWTERASIGIMAVDILDDAVDLLKRVSNRMFLPPLPRQFLLVFETIVFTMFLDYPVPHINQPLP